MWRTWPELHDMEDQMSKPTWIRLKYSLPVVRRSDVKIIIIQKPRT